MNIDKEKRELLMELLKTESTAMAAGDREGADHARHAFEQLTLDDGSDIYEKAIVDRIVYFAAKAREFHKAEDFEAQSACGADVLVLADCLVDARIAAGDVPELEGFYS